MYDWDTMETDYKSGRRWIPVRRTAGELWLDTEFVLDSMDEAREAVQFSNSHWGELAAEWPIIGVAEVMVEIIDLHSLEMLPAPR